MTLSKLMCAAPLALAMQLAALPALADTGHGHGGPAAGLAPQGGQYFGRDGGSGMAPGMGGMMDPAMMMRMHAMMSSMMGGGMMDGGMMGGGMMGGMTGGPAQGAMMPGMMNGMMSGGAMRMLDTDADGSLAPDELDSGLQQALASYDADGNGTLSIGEFEAWHSALIRSQMVDRFQSFDEDGDGEVTAAELAVPAMMMRQEMSRRTQPATPDQPMQGQGMGMGDTGSGN